jgi:hypothetical protein
MTDRISERLDFQDLFGRTVHANFDGGFISSDGGALLLRELEARFGFLDAFADCFTDYRLPERREFTVAELLKQRVFGLCLGYEDLNDHDRLRFDPLLATLVGRRDPTGQDRHHPEDRGAPLAGKSTLNRLELTAVGADADERYKKIVANMRSIEDFLLDACIHQQTTTPTRIVLDLDATDDPIHGHQLGRFFHGYYGHYCYLPLYIFWGEHPLCARLRPSDIDASCGSLRYVQRIVQRFREQWPNVALVLRADSGFCRDDLMTWCERNRVDYVFGLPKNTRLLEEIRVELAAAEQGYQATKQATRVFRDFRYQTRDSWSAERRVVGKAEHLAKGANPRFVVTSLSSASYDARTLYEQEYCARGEMENRIKEQQGQLWADRGSCQTMRANQLRLYFATVAYLVLRALREHGLKETSLDHAQVSTMRERLFKIGAWIEVSVRRVVVSLSQAYPWRDLWQQVWQQVCRLPERLLRPRLAPVPPAVPSS